MDHKRSNPDVDHTKGKARHPHRIVVVEDHPLVRRGVVASLRQAGFDVVSDTSDGQSAIEIVRRERPDVVIMDLELPFVSGVDATRELRHLVPDVAVLAFTMHDDHTTVTDVREAGGRGLVSKNDDTNALVSAIEDVLAGIEVWPPGSNISNGAGL